MIIFLILIMKKTISYFAVGFFLFSIVISCQKTKKQLNPSLNEIQVTNAIGDNSLLKIEITKIIPLETNNESIFNHISKLILTDERYFIFDDFSSGIFVFSKSGTFEFNVTKKGKGPGELSNPCDFLVDTLSKTIEIYEMTRHHIVRFNFSGEFIDEIEIGLPIEEIAKIDPETYVVYIGNMDRIYYDDKKISHNLLFFQPGKGIIKQFHEFTGIGPFYELKYQPFYKTYDDELLFKSPGDFNLYKIDRDGMHAIWQLDFNGKFVNREEIELNSSNFTEWNNKVLPKTGKIYRINDTFETRDFLYISYVQSGKVQISIIDKQSVKSFYTSSLNDFISKNVGPFIGKVVGAYESGIILAVDANSIVENLKKVDKKPVVNNVFSKISDSILEGDNKLLIFINISKI